MNNDKPSVRRFYSKHPIVSHIIIMAATAVVLVWFAMIFLNVWTHHGSTSTVPQVKNLPYSTAAELLRDWWRFRIAVRCCRRVRLPFAVFQEPNPLQV